MNFAKTSVCELMFCLFMKATRNFWFKYGVLLDVVNGFLQVGIDMIWVRGVVVGWCLRVV